MSEIEGFLGITESSRSTACVVIFALGNPQDLDKFLSLCVYSLIEFCDLARAVYVNLKTSLILEVFEDNHFNKESMIIRVMDIISQKF